METEEYPKGKNNTMAEQEFWSSQFLNRLNWKGAVSYEKENIPGCVSKFWIYLLA